MTKMITTIILSFRPRAGQLVLLPVTGQLSCTGCRKLSAKDFAAVVDSVFLDADLCEEMDAFDFAEAGAFCATLRPLTAEDEPALEARLAANRADRAKLAAAIRARRAEQRQAKKEAAALEQLHSGLDRLAHTDFDWDTVYPTLELPRVPCTQPGCTQPACFHAGVWYQQQGWTEMLTTSLAGWYTTGNRVYKHPALDIYVESFGNRSVVYASPDTVDGWLAAKAAKWGLTKAEAEYWLQQFDGCVGSEVYRYVATH